MAEKSSELIEEIKMIDTDSTEDATSEDTTLQTRLKDDTALTETEVVGETTDADTDADAADDEVTAETEQLREQIEETRRGMGETIDAIQEKLSFANISEQVQAQVSEQISGAVETAKGAFYDKAGEIVNTVGRSFRQIGKSDLAKKAQDNPTALALIGAGIGALLVSMLVDSKKKSKRKTASYNYDYDSSDDEVRFSDSSRQELTSSQSTDQSESTLQLARKRVGDTASSAYESVSGAAGTAYEGVSGAAGTAYEGVTSAAGSAYETLGSAASKTYEGVTSVAEKTYEGVGSVAGKTYQGVTTAAGYAYDKAGDLGGQVKINYDHYIEENPLAVGAVALALGAAVGFAIPLTSKENEYLGEYRDQVVEKAAATAQDAIGTVKQMATEAQKVITSTLR